MDKIKTRSMNELRNSTFVQDNQHWKVLEWVPKDMEYRCQSLDTGLVRRFTCDELLIALMRESWGCMTMGKPTTIYSVKILRDGKGNAVKIIKIRG